MNKGYNSNAGYNGNNSNNNYNNYNSNTDYFSHGRGYASYSDYIRGGSFFTTDRILELAASRREAEKKIMRQCESKVDQLFKVTAPEKYGFEMRDGQYDMAMDIMEALEDGNHIAVEAGVGIGKSFAYLAPMILLYKATGRPVIIATSTIALQEQLVGDVEKMAEMLGVTVTPLVAKGQTNYLCRRKAESYLSSTRIDLDEELVDSIIADINRGCSERTAFREQIPDKAWNRMCVKRFSRSRCNQKSCPYYGECAYCKLRNEMPEAGFTICNQDLLTVHLNNMSEGYRAILNPDAKYIVVDEAHNLEDKVRSMTTCHITADGLHTMVDNALNQGAKHSEVISSSDIVECSDAVDAFFWNLQQQRKRQINKAKRLKRVSRKQGSQNIGHLCDDAVDRFFVRDEDGAFSLLKGMTKSLKKILDGIDIGNAFEDNKLEYSAVEDLGRTADDLGKLCKDTDKYILWMERCRGGIEFSFCPKDTAGLTKRLYFDSGHKVVLTSATLTGKNTGGLSEQYAYLTKGIGFPAEENGGELSEPKESPFDYDSRAMIYYCDDLPHPTSHREEFIVEGTERLIELLSISHGRTLVLFTAKEDMEQVGAILKEKDLPYHILMQRKGVSQQELLDEFRRDTGSVLLGTGSYWEGVNVEGESLSNVVIFRLPFPVPDPIIEYKQSLTEDGLNDVLVPEMIIKLKQGIGRLIRSEQDSGIVCIIDKRLGDSARNSYKETVWDALPIKNRTSDLDELRRFYDTVCTTGTDEADKFAEAEGTPIENG